MEASQMDEMNFWVLICFSFLFINFHRLPPCLVYSNFVVDIKLNVTFCFFHEILEIYLGVFTISIDFIKVNASCCLFEIYQRFY